MKPSDLTSEAVTSPAKNPGVQVHASTPAERSVSRGSSSTRNEKLLSGLEIKYRDNSWNPGLRLGNATKRVHSPAVSTGRQEITAVLSSLLSPKTSGSGRFQVLRELDHL